MTKNKSMPSVPKHIAIIMDGNGRWAEKRKLPKIAGHRAGVAAVERVIEAARDLGVEVLTFYTFSTENWKRPKKEVSALMGLIAEYIGLKGKELIKQGARVRVIGRSEELPPEVQKKLKELEESSAKNKKILVNFAINYGGRTEITDAARKIAKDVQSNKISPEDITEEKFSSYLYTAGTPDPELVVRTSGEMRISNFLLWQISYSELYVTDTLWPDFEKKDLEQAIATYNKRDRRYGG